MFQFEEPMESLYAQCVPFDEGPLSRSGEYAQLTQALQSARRMLERHAPESIANLDAYLDTYLELVELECRHYFAEGCRLGREAKV